MAFKVLQSAKLSVNVRNSDGTFIAQKDADWWLKISNFRKSLGGWDRDPKAVADGCKFGEQGINMSQVRARRGRALCAPAFALLW